MVFPELFRPTIRLMRRSPSTSSEPIPRKFLIDILEYIVDRLSVWNVGQQAYHNPNPFLRARTPSTQDSHQFPWIKGRERLSQFPEPGLLADSIINQEPLQGVGSSAGEEEHGLLDPVERVSAVVYSGEFASWGETSARASRYIAGLRTEPVFIYAERLLAFGWTFRLAAPCGLEGVCRLTWSTHWLWRSRPCEQEWLPFGNKKKAGCLALYLDNRFQGVEIGPQPLGDLPSRVRLGGAPFDRAVELRVCDFGFRVVLVYHKSRAV